MPDILTHLLVGVSIAFLVLKDCQKSEQMLIVFGALVSDIGHPLTWLLESTPYCWIGFASAFHSILGVVMLSYVGAACFKLNKTNYKNQFALILIGCASHLILDMLMYPWTELGIPLLYPLRFSFSFHLLWPDFWLYPLIGVILLLISLVLTHLVLRYR